MHTIVELPEYLRTAEKLLSENARREIITFLAMNPRKGALIRGTGGIRKMRWGRGSSGKSGGVRIVYFYYDENMPLYLLSVFGKGDKENLSKSERNELGTLARTIVQTWKNSHE